MRNWPGIELKAGRSLLCLFALGSAGMLAATPSGDDAEAEVKRADAAFWAAYNSCDERQMAAFFTDDAEFYHDRTGLNVGGAQVTASMMSGPCANPNEERLRREEITGTMRFDPLAGGYALLAGEHRFLLTRLGEAERPSGVGRFTSIWQRVGSEWRMRRIVSYAHGPDLPKLIVVPTSREALARLIGDYAGEGGAAAKVSIDGDALTLASGGAVFNLIPIGPGRFGVGDRPVQFAFSNDAVEVIEDGATVARMRRVASAK